MGLFRLGVLGKRTVASIVVVLSHIATEVETFVVRDAIYLTGVDRCRNLNLAFILLHVELVALHKPKDMQ
jgi:hypothetical protein